MADRTTGLARRARYEDFAVLLRSTGNQVHFEKYFRLFDVPYGSENACGLFSEAVACDLYYALRLALYPEDRNALAAYLRSPFAGLSDDALVRILATPAASDVLSPETGAVLRERDRTCWERGAETIRTLAAMADRAPICACLSFLWFETGYRAALLLDPVASAFEEHFELLHSLAVRADARGECLSAFVAELEPLVGKPDKLEIELPRESSRGVRIMTIHKSKGLEFPVVIVPQANNVGQDWGTRDAWYWEEGLGPTFRPPRVRCYSIAQRVLRACEGRPRGPGRGRAQAPAVRRPDSRGIAHHRYGHRAPRRGHARTGASARFSPRRSASSLRPLPLAGAEEAKTTRLDLPPFGRPSALPSGVLVGRSSPSAATGTTSSSRPEPGAEARAPGARTPGPSPPRPRFPSSSGPSGPRPRR